ncbi:MAG: ISKra4 family transposase [Opitutae bacterium]|jgi:hypothetical protein|nr:ISKra4 family transposase [Opitutae bacterium]NLF98974.1 ISKra4 family transposase [Lentisphaerota bacterium]
MLRAAVQKDAADLIEGFLNHELPHLLTNEPPRSDERMHSMRERQVVTLFGPIRLRRAYFVGSRGGRCPLDERLGLHHRYTPAVVQLMCWAGAMDPSFAQAGEVLRRMAALDIPERQIQRVVNDRAPAAAQWMRERPADKLAHPIPILNIQADMTGIPMRPEELEGVRGKQPDGSAKTRQIKLGCVFTQSIDAKGEPQRDPSSCTYLGSFEDVAGFGRGLHAEACTRGYATARTVVFLGDGAEWIWNMAADRFRGAVQIVDFFHACEHLHQLCETLEPNPAHAKGLFDAWRRRLKQNGLPRILDEAAKRAASLPADRAQDVVGQLAYFRTHASRMTYRTFRRKGYFIGSGAIEGGCRHVIAQRTKLSGMRWSMPGAAHVLAFRCLVQSNLFDDYCKSSLKAS